MNKVFGLLAGDEIVAIGGMRLKDPPYNDPEMARATLYEAKLRQQPLTVLRNGEEIQLMGVAHGTPVVPPVRRASAHRPS